jgi:hypothetical protein
MTEQDCTRLHKIAQETQDCTRLHKTAQLAQDCTTTGTRLHKIGVQTKVDCSGKNLRVLRKIWGFWNTFSSNNKIDKDSWSTNYMGCLTEFYDYLTLFYTKISFKILKFPVRPSDFFPSNLLYTHKTRELNTYKKTEQQTWRKLPRSY